MTKSAKPAAKTSRPVTLKHLAATLAEEHQLTKRAGEAILDDATDYMTTNGSGSKICCRAVRAKLA